MKMQYIKTICLAVGLFSLCATTLTAQDPYPTINPLATFTKSDGTTETGTEYSGPWAAMTGLFDGRACIFADAEESDPQALALIEGFAAKSLLADRGYDTNKIIKEATRTGIQVVIPPKKNRKEQREYDKEVYRVRHLVENAFLHLKGWRGIATCYTKNVSFLASSL